MHSPTGFFVVLADQEANPKLCPILAWLPPMAEGAAFGAIVLVGSGRGGFPATIKNMQFDKHGTPDREMDWFAFGIFDSDYISEDTRKLVRQFWKDRDKAWWQQSKERAEATNPTNPTNQ